MRALPEADWLTQCCPSHVDPAAFIAAVFDPTSVVHAAFHMGARYQREAVRSQAVANARADADETLPYRSER